MNIHLIAVHYDNSKNVIGFRLFDSDNKQVMDQPYNAVKNVLAAKTVNIHGIEYRSSDGKLHGDNGRFERYPILFNNALIQKSIVIINTIDDAGYTICNFKGQTGEVEKEQLVKYANTSMNIANGKLITKDGSQFISAIQGSYDNIPLSSTQLGVRIRNKKINREYAKDIKNIRKQEIKKRPAGLKLYNDPRLPRVITGIPAPNSKLKEKDPETNMTVEEKMAYTMIAMKDVRPFYHSIFSILKKVEAIPQDDVKTMAVSISTLYFSADYVRDTMLPYLLFISLHEVCHLGMKHRIRRGDRDHDIWNMACDYYINAALAKEFGLREPGDIVEARSILRDKGDKIDPSIKHYKIGLPMDALFNPYVSVERDTPETLYAELIKKANEKQQQSSGDNEQNEQDEQGEQSQDGQSQNNRQQQNNEQQQQENEDTQQNNEQEQQEDGNMQSEDAIDFGGGQVGEDKQQGNDSGNMQGQDGEQDESDGQGQGQGQGNGQEQGKGTAQSRGDKPLPSEGLGEDNDDTSVNNLDDFSSGRETISTQVRKSEAGSQDNNKNTENSDAMGDGTQDDIEGESGQEQEEGKGKGQEDKQGKGKTEQGKNEDDGFDEPYGDKDQKDSNKMGAGNEQGTSGEKNSNNQDANSSKPKESAIIEDGDHSQSESNSTKSKNDIKEQRKRGRLAGKEFRGQTIPDLGTDMVDDQETEGKTNDQLRQKANSLLSRAVVIHKQKHKFGGDNADFLERYVEEALAPKVNWKTLLKNRLTKATQKVNTFSAPDRRFISRNMLMPGPKALDNDYIENIKICIDTSGSISNVELGMALSQIQQLFKMFKASAELIYWDTRVRAVYEFKNVKELLDKKPMGGGGTDANCVFDYFENSPDYKRRRKKQPSVIIIFTDGYIPSVDKKYKKFRDTIWIISDKDNTFKAPFGVVAKLKYNED